MNLIQFNLGNRHGIFNFFNFVDQFNKFVNFKTKV